MLIQKNILNLLTRFQLLAIVLMLGQNDTPGANANCPKEKARSRQADLPWCYGGLSAEIPNQSLEDCGALCRERYLSSLAGRGREE